jgi:hemerythrin-like domain-containing protein
MTKTMTALLAAEHAELEALFERVSSPDEDRVAVLNQLTRLLSAHVDVERQLLLPVLEDRVPDGEALSSQIRDDHKHIDHHVKLLERRKPNSPDVPDLVTDLLHITTAHVSLANARVLPGLEQALSETELGELGQQMSSDERRVLNHPHPALPNRGPLATVTRKAAEMVDHLRDRSAAAGRLSDSAPPD